MKKSLEKNSPATTAGNGEIGIIRNILMGEHIAQFESSFKSLQEIIEKNDRNSNDQLVKMENSFNQRLSELEKNTTDWFDALEKNTNSRLEKIEQLFNKRLGELETKMQEDKSDDRETISDLLSTLSKTIAAKK